MSKPEPTQPPGDAANGSSVCSQFGLQPDSNSGCDLPRHSLAASDYVKIQCGCMVCLDSQPDDGHPVRPSRRIMVVCRICGNKRCPHATNHIHACTGSNDRDQPGSYYCSGWIDERPSWPPTSPPAAAERELPDEPGLWFRVGVPYLIARCDRGGPGDEMEWLRLAFDCRISSGPMSDAMRGGWLKAGTGEGELERLRQLAGLEPGERLVKVQDDGWCLIDGPHGHRRRIQRTTEREIDLTAQLTAAQRRVEELSGSVSYQLEVQDSDNEWNVLGTVPESEVDPDEWFADARGFHANQDMQLVRVTRKVVYSRPGGHP